MTDFEQAKWIIKSKISCIDVADIIGYEHSKNGRGVCPFHAGANNPTCFQLFPITNKYDGGYYCHSCHESGDVISFVQKMLGLSYSEAIQWFKDTYKLALPEVKEVPKELQHKLNQEGQLRKELYMCTDLATQLYCKVMENGNVDLIKDSNSLYSKLETMLQSFKKL